MSPNSVSDRVVCNICNGRFCLRRELSPVMRGAAGRLCNPSPAAAAGRGLSQVGRLRQPVWRGGGRRIALPSPQPHFS